MRGIRATEAGIFWAIERSAEVRRAVVRREVDQQHDELGVQVGVWTQKVAGPVANELRLDAYSRPLGSEARVHLSGKCLQHGLSHVFAEKPRVETVPNRFLFTGKTVRPAVVHVSLISVTEVIEFQRCHFV